MATAPATSGGINVRMNYDARPTTLPSPSLSLDNIGTDDMKIDEKPKTYKICFHGGDNMLGRGIQLTLPHQLPGEDSITDSCSAWHYLLMGMHIHDSNDANVHANELKDIRSQNKLGTRLWGDSLALDIQPDLRILNLETAVTRSITNDDIPWDKRINYHLNVDNFPDVFRSFSEAHGASHYAVVMSNNHALDFGRKAFDADTISIANQLPGHGHLVGIGHNRCDATTPVMIKTDRGRIHIVAAACACSGCPRGWDSGAHVSGLVWLPAITGRTNVQEAVWTLERMIPEKADGDIIILSIHWGPNWAYLYSDDDGQVWRRQLAKACVDHLGVDIIYGHSSHHIRGMELLKSTMDGADKLVIYGAGDLVNDYEGFQNPGEESYSKLGAVTLVDMDAVTGGTKAIELIPFYMDKLQLKRVHAKSEFWNPQTRRYETNPLATQMLLEQINRMSQWDSGVTGNPVSLRLDTDSADDSLPVLRYP
ncbi:hypothetical protein CYMTET_26637 [Cymbomonas tetramitiformis]|uniref:Capsule synthesis protein CapA domain-containing protein n=1 Tax=Cymbomonas tetramitiformis TaxID=36881 RepID=A0AAE0FRD0_9CHLO|nr:hypothetical protein CYMTET_26637 [Cymbomonas tetramitiformis]|eukprot:gene1027-1556_t